MQREWSLDAATRALPGLRPLIALLREQRRNLEAMKDDLLRLRRLERTGARPGGADQPQPAATATESAAEALMTSAMVELRIRALVDQMQASVDRVASRGVELRDIERGLIDFPAVADGRPFLFCWQESDGDEVAFAHAFGEGFGARLPLAAFLHQHISEQ